MTLGEKIKAARLEAGLSQRQLCGDAITRNMLSQIENGSARPSMQTLQYFAVQLGKPVSWFLQEDSIHSPNSALMAQAREAYGKGQHGKTLALLSAYRGPDPLFDQEMRYLFALAALAQAQLHLQVDDAAQAVRLLEQIDRDCIYYRPEQEQLRRQLLHRSYPLLEEEARKAQDFEKAYLYACKARALPR